MPVSPAAIVAAVVTAAVTAATVGIDEGPLDEEEDVVHIRDVDELGFGAKPGGGGRRGTAENWAAFPPVWGPGRGVPFAG